MKTTQSFGVHFTIKKEKAKDGVTYRKFVPVAISPVSVQFTCNILSSVRVPGGKVRYAFSLDLCEGFPTSGLLQLSASRFGGKGKYIKMSAVMDS